MPKDAGLDGDEADFFHTLFEDGHDFLAATAHLCTDKHAAEAVNGQELGGVGVHVTTEPADVPGEGRAGGLERDGQAGPSVARGGGNHLVPPKPLNGHTRYAANAGVADKRKHLQQQQQQQQQQQ